MSTLNTFGFPYCTPAIFLERYDVRTVGDYLSDTDLRLTPTQVQNSAVLADLMKQASGIVESHAFMGTRYSPVDLQLIASMDNTGTIVGTPTNAAQVLYGIVAGITMFLVWERRPLRYAKHPMPLSSEMAFGQLEKIGAGALIFGLLETAEAGVPSVEFMTKQDILTRNFSSNQARRFFGDRAQYQVPGP